MSEQPLVNLPPLVVVQSPHEIQSLIRLEALLPDRHPLLVYIASLAPGSRRTMRQALEVIAMLVSSGRADARTLKWEDLRYQHCQAVRAALVEKFSPATVNKMLSALRRVLREAWRLRLMSAEDYHRASDVPTVRSQPLPRGRSLSAGELRALFESCADGSKAGVRDAALLAACYAGGLRRSEVVALHVSDFQPQDGALTVREGKGRKGRVVYLSNGGLDALIDWLALRGSSPGWLFCPVNKSDRITLRGITDQSVLGITRKRAGEAGVARFSPHDLRRTFVSDLLDAGADLSTAKRLAGHSSEATTGRYDRRGEEAKKKAAQLLHVPYVRTGMEGRTSPVRPKEG